MEPDQVTCLFSHKCSEESHNLGETLRKSLREAAIELLIDPFRCGDDAATRMDSFRFDALLFLCSPDSLASKPCQRELSTARRHSIPILIAQLMGTPVPGRLKKKIYWSIPGVKTREFATGTRALSHAIRARAEFHRALDALAADKPPDETRIAAQAIALEADRTFVAECVSLLAKKYSDFEDATTRFWIAQALGSAGTAKAAMLLRRIPAQDHPYAQEGIRQALEMINLGR